jgi:hypothetical protein
VVDHETVSGIRLVGTAFVATSIAVVSRPSAAAPTTMLQNPLVAPVECAECHEFLNPLELEDEPAISPMLVWRGTMMANSARDPVFWAAVAVAAQDAEADATGLLAGATESCVRCHAPRAFLEGNGMATSVDELTNTQREGVECEACHRMMDDGVTPAGNAQYVLDDVLVGENVPRRGPWTYDPAAPETHRPPHETIADPFTASSRLCGTCHDVTTPRDRVDDDGVVVHAGFNEQRTYSEWLGSAFAVEGDDFRSCADCHMPAVEDAAGCGPFYEEHDPTLLHPEGARRHELLGANRVMLEILRDLYGADEVPAEHFDLTLERTDAFLQGAASIDIELPDVIDVTQGIDALDVTVTNQSGHKLPSGYSEGRMAWLEVTVTYDGEAIFSSGLWDDATGLQTDDQLRVYEAIADEHATGKTSHLLLNDHWVVDTRIPPRGLKPDPQTDPVGERYALLEDGTWAHHDTVSYAFAGRDDVEDTSPQNANDAVDVQVRLLYLVNTPEYIELLRDDNFTSDAGQLVFDLFEEAGHARPVVLGHVVRKLPVVGLVGQPMPPAADDTTTGSSPGGSSSGTGEGLTDTEAAAADADGGCGCRSSAPVGLPWSIALLLLRCRTRRRDDRRSARRS